MSQSGRRRAGPSAEQRFSWADILSGAAAIAGAAVEWTDSSGSAGLIRLAGGEPLFFHKGVLDINRVAAARIAKDKGFCSELLRNKGHRVPEEQAFFHEAYARREGKGRGPDAAARYAAQLGYPVFVKPVHLSQGRFVAKVHSEAELRHAIERMAGHDTVYLVQRPCAGADLRVVVVNGRIAFVFERTPLAVAGDGRATIAELVEEKQAGFEASGRDTMIELDDPRIAANLARRGFTIDHVPAAGETVQLHDISNLSVGGMAEDKTETYGRRLAGSAASVAGLLRLGFCGIDFLVAPGDPDAVPVVLEVNSAPGLDHYLYSGKGALREVQELYAKVLELYASTSPPWA